MTQTIMVSESTSDSDMLTALSAGSGDFEVVWQLQSEDAFQSTGMVAIESGIVTANDVARVLEVAMSLNVASGMVLVQASTVCLYFVGDDIQTEYMPLGLPGKRLEAKLSLGLIPSGTLQRWKILASAAGRKMTGWRIEVA